MTELLPRDQIFINKLTEIIRKNLGNENFDVKEFASQSGLSHYRLSRKLYAITNKTVRQFIRETRLLKALEMLQNEELTAAEVAYKVGFSSPAYFNTCFHEFFGYSPGKVKKVKISTSGEIRTDFEAERGRQQLPSGGFRRIYIISSRILFGVFLIYLGHNYLTKDSFHNSGALKKGQEKSIAVIPFLNLSDSSANQYFIDGIMEEILTNLSRIHDLRVISRTSVEQFRKNIKSAIEIGKKLNVDYIVEGSGQKYGNTFRLRVQLIEASTDKHIWAKSYQKEIAETRDIFMIQSQVAQSIAAELKTSLSPSEKKLIEKISTTDLSAYDFYQRGVMELRRYKSDHKNTQSLKRAAELYKTALECDSTFAEAYLGLGDVYWSKYVFESYYSKNYLDSVIILANLALSYDNQLAEAYNARADYYIQNGMTEKAIHDFDKAINYNPNYWEAYYGLGYKVYITDYQNMDFVKGLEYIQKAVGINHSADLPFLLRELGDSYGTWAGFPETAAYYYQEALKLDGDTARYFWHMGDEQGASGNYEKAIELYTLAHAIDSNIVGITASLASNYELLGQYKKSLKYIRKFESRIKDLPQLFYGSNRWMGYVYWQNGYKEKAWQLFIEQKRVIDESLKNGRFYSIDANYDLAALYNFMGQKEKAYRNLKVVTNIHVCPKWLINLIKNDPFFNNIRNEPEFKKIVSELEAKYQAEHERVRKYLEESGTSVTISRAIATSN